MIQTKFKKNRILFVQAIILLFSIAAPISANSSEAEDSESLASQASLASVATRVTAAELSQFVSGHYLGFSSGMRFRLGGVPSLNFSTLDFRKGWTVAASEPTPLPDQGFDWSSITLWVNPVVSGVENRIVPMTSEGTVKVAMLGAEHSSDDQSTVIGLSFSRDWLDIDTPYNDGTVSGSGSTLSPYLTFQLNQTWTLDASAGLGQSDVKSRTSTQTSKPKIDRQFFSFGLTHAQISGKWVLLSKVSFSNSKDEVKSFITSTNQFIDSSTTQLNQVKAGLYALYSRPPISPFIAIYQIHNDFSVRSSSLQKPREYSSVQQLQIGLNASSGPLYGAIAYQTERSRSQWRIYAGVRY